MARLTIAEKSHWKDRITSKINQRLEALYASQPGFQDELSRQARQQALESLGLLELQQELDELELHQQQINQQRQQVQRSMLARVRQVRPEDLPSYLTPSRCHQDALQAVNARQRVHEQKLLNEYENGRQILQLRREQEELLDTIWLASSPAEVRTLFQKVSELLEEKLTPLQQDAMTIPVME